MLFYIPIWTNELAKHNIKVINNWSWLINYKLERHNHIRFPRQAWPIIKKEGTGPTLRMRIMVDSIVTLFLVLLVIAGINQSYLAAMGAGDFSMNNCLFIWFSFIHLFTKTCY